MVNQLQHPNIAMTEDQVREAEQALMVLNRLIPQVDALAQCGVDCQARRQRIEQLRQGLQSLLQHFGST